MKITEHELRHMYCDDGMTQLEIADVYGVVQSTILKWMRIYEIESRTNSESKLGNSMKPLKNVLEKMYLIKKMSMREISNEFGVNQATILNWMRSYNIKSRTLFDFVGKKNGNWQGGISFEPYCSKFNKTFKESVRKRDDYTCQLCGLKQNNRKLSVHHIHYEKSDCWPDVISLCHSCHGKVNGNRDYWEEYFENQLLEKGLMYWSLSQET